VDNFWHLVAPMCASAYNPRFVGMEGADLDDPKEWIKAAIELFPNGFRNLSSLQRLTLEFFHDSTPVREEGLTNLSKLLESLHKLRHLRISFGFIAIPHPLAAPALRFVMTKDVHFPYLRTFSMQAFIAPEKLLRAFLSSHSSTLRSVELSEIKLRSHIPDLPKADSFVDLFNFMRNNLSLEHVCFNGNLTDQWDQAWFSPKCDDNGDDFDYDCLKYRIERFITKGEQWPIQPISEEDEDEDEDGYFEEDDEMDEREANEPWEYYKDESWRRQAMF
jgi:hypothetical protein